MKNKPQNTSVSQQIETIISKAGGWRGRKISQIRQIIKHADSDVVEEVKWRMPSRPEGLPVWSHNGILCIAEIFKNKVTLTFFKGAQMKDPKKLFNSRLKSKTDRAIDFHEEDVVNEAEIKELILEAVRINTQE